jgi:prevent-host-death family protein
MGYIRPMQATVRVPTAVFKSNMRPFVDRARAGETVIVTNDGEDDFKVLPVLHSGPPPVSKTPLPAESYRGVDVDEPAFAPLA